MTGLARSGWSDIRERLARLAAHPGAANVFGAMGHGWQLEPLLSAADLTDLATLAQPFPHTAAFNPADGLPEPPDEEDFESVAAFNAAEDVYWARHDEVVFRPEHSIGLLS